MSEKLTRIIAYVLIGIFSVSILCSMFFWKIYPNLRKNSNVSGSWNETVSALSNELDREDLNEQTSMQDSEPIFSGERDSRVEDNPSLINMPRDTDDVYFQPITDDYIYVLYSSNYGDIYGNDTEEQLLYSFDENGRVVQHLSRSAWSTPLEAGFNLADHVGGPEYEPFYTVFDTVWYQDVMGMIDSILGGYSHYDDQLYYTDKSFVLSDIEGNSLEYYLSKPDENITKEFENMSQSDEYKILQYIELVTDDYYVEKYVETITEGEFTILRDENVIFFDESGRATKYLSLREYGSKEQAQKVYDGATEQIKGIMTIYDNIAVFDSMQGYIPDSYYEFKSHYYPSEDRYFSKPYLTSSQFKYWLEH